MKKFLVLVAGLLALAATGTKTASTVPTEVKAFVKSYADAYNRDDATDQMDMMSHREGVSSVGMGEITRGWDAIRSETDEAAGSAARPKVTLGVIDVQPLGIGYALAVAPITAAVTTEQGVVELRGVMTLVLEKTGGAWKVLHEHGSFKIPEAAEAD